MTTELELIDRLADAAAGAPDDLGVSIAELRRRGRRRRQTRLAVTSAAAGLVTVGLVAGSAVYLSGGAPQAVGAPGPSAPATRSAPAAPAGTPSPTGTDALLLSPSTVIDTGEPAGGGTLVLWFAPAQEHFLLVVGVRMPDGTRQVLGVTNDPEVPAPGPGGPGFHGGWETVVDQRRLLLGYVVGDVAKVTLNVQGTPRTANVRPWPDNPAVHVWWVQAPDSLDLQAEVTDLRATDSTGTVVAVVPTGGTAVG